MPKKVRPSQAGLKMDSHLSPPSHMHRAIIDYSHSNSPGMDAPPVVENYQNVAFYDEPRGYDFLFSDSLGNDEGTKKSRGPEMNRKKWMVVIATLLCLSIAVLMAGIFLYSGDNKKRATAPSNTAFMPDTDAHSSDPHCTWPDLSGCGAKVVLQDAGLTGTIPKNIGKWTNIKHLDLRNNMLRGSMPDALGSLTELTFLNLSANNLEGNIPTTLGNLSLLSFLYLYDDLGGSIPSELGMLTRLTFLGLQQNNLTGSIPATLAALTNLHILNLDNNNLSGVFPNALRTLTNLQHLQLYENELLRGRVPSEFCATTKAMIDCHRMECRCCTSYVGESCRADGH